MRETIETVADLAQCHPNTVRSCLDGRRVQFIKAHGVFTALNILSRNSFDRVSHVQYYDPESNEYRADPALKDCRVLKRGNELLRRLKTSVEQIASDTGINYIDAAAVLQGRKPVASNIVDAIFAELLKLDGALVLASEVIR